MTTQQRIILLVVSSSIFFEALDIAIINLAMPLIQADFKLTSDQVQWAQTLYILFYGGFLIVGGKLADVVGRKRIFMLGSSLFLLTSLGAGVASSFEVMIIFRAVQGLGAALVIPSAFAIITNTFVETQVRNKAIGVFGSFAAIGSGSGLSIGGLIATYWGWQWIFFINVPVIALALVLANHYIPQDKPEPSTDRPDFISGVILTLFILMLTYGIHEIKSLSQHPWILVILVVLAGVMLWIFIQRARRPNPLIRFSLFRKRGPLTGYGVMVLLGAFFSGYLFLISLVFQLQLHFTAAKAGFVLLPFSVLSAIVSKSLLLQLLKRISIWSGAILGMTLMTAGGLFLLTGLLFHNDLLLIILSIACVTGTGIAVCFMTLNVLIIREIPEQDHGLASSIGTTSFFFGGALGLTLIGLAMQMVPGYTIPVIILTAYGAAGVVGLIICSPKARED